MRFPLKLGGKALPIYFICGIIIIGIITFIYSNRFTNQLSSEAQKTSRLFAEFIQHPTKSSEEISDYIFREVIQKIEFPVVLTDTAGEPISWRNIGPENMEIDQIKKVIKRLDEEHTPIAIKVTTGRDSLFVSYVHYGLSPLARTLKVIPFVLTGFLSIFLLLGVWGYLQYRKSIEEKIWASMAKETAHQLGTPVSSIVGWLETLKGQIDEDHLSAMVEDVNRMQDVLEKFSRIGTEPKLELSEPNSIISPAVKYIKRRSHKNVEIIEDYKAQIKIMVDPILMRWAIENLMKNSLDAIGSEKGKIIVATSKFGEYFKISVSDTGGGIKGGNKIFEPGHSTKKYGWGIGLVLTKRIVEEHHKGKLFLETNTPQLTTFSIILPKAE